MKYRKLDSKSDYSFGNNNLDFYIDSPEAVAQCAQTNLKLFVGEWFLDITAGTPYPESILGTHSKDEADAALLSVIRKVQGVVNVVNFQSSREPATRAYSMSGTLNTIYGQTQLEIDNAKNF